jgi:hypothetical protein
MAVVLLFSVTFCASSLGLAGISNHEKCGLRGVLLIG